MKFTRGSLQSAPATFLVVGLAGLVAVLAVWFVGGLGLPLPWSASQSAAAVAANLSSADNFAILGATTIDTSNISVISGDVGLSPASGSFIVGLTAGQVSGTIYAVDAAGPASSVSNAPLLTLAKNALTAAYLDIAAQTPVTTIASELGGSTKFAGIYDSGDGTFGLTGTVTLDAQGDPNAVFIFKMATTLTTAGSSVVNLINGAQACKVYWQVGSSATLGTNSTFKGNILALTSITLTSGVNVEGTLLARNGAVTLDANTITKSTCAAVPPAPGSPEAALSAIGSTFVPLPLINVTKIPDPLALPAGPGPVTYTYVVTNVGGVAMSNIWVKDDKCSNVQFVSGDSDNDTMLDLNEAWTYRCTKTLFQTEANAATAHGFSNGWDGYDTANAIVAVGIPLPAPLIHLVKQPNVFILGAGGGPVTYTYTVTNPGIAALHDVSVIDDKCTGLPGRVVGHPGDLNKNNLLESNEIWKFTCETNLTQTTTNIGTAEGHANGLTAIDFSPATVVVASPGLPNTGFIPEGIPWNYVLLSGALGVLLGIVSSLSIYRRKTMM